MSKVLLGLEDDYDFALIGISSHTRDYRLCWEINKLLKIDLVKGNDLEISKKNEITSCSFYEFIDEDNYLEYYLIANLGDNGYLVKEQNTVDFFLMMKGNISDNLIANIILKINTLSLVLTSFNFDPNQLKSKQNLLF